MTSIRTPSTSGPGCPTSTRTRDPGSGPSSGTSTSPRGFPATSGPRTTTGASPRSSISRCCSVSGTSASWIRGFRSGDPPGRNTVRTGGRLQVVRRGEGVETVVGRVPLPPVLRPVGRRPVRRRELQHRSVRRVQPAISVVDTRHEGEQPTDIFGGRRLREPHLSGVSDRGLTTVPSLPPRGEKYGAALPERHTSIRCSLESGSFSRSARRLYSRHPSNSICESSSGS